SSYYLLLSAVQKGFGTAIRKRQYSLRRRVLRRYEQFLTQEPDAADLMLVRCPTNIRYGKVAAEASRGEGKEIWRKRGRHSVDAPVPLTSLATTGSRADHRAFRFGFKRMSSFPVSLLAAWLFSASLSAQPVFAQS